MQSILSNEALLSMDARVISAFARVFDALLPGHDESRTAAPVQATATQ
jgi:hypothetical protein